MYTCSEYTLYDTIYSDERTLQMHVHPPPPKIPQTKTNKQTNKQTNKNISSPHLQNYIWPQLNYVFIKATKISPCIKILNNVTGSMNCHDIRDEMFSVWVVHDKLIKRPFILRPNCANRCISSVLWYLFPLSNAFSNWSICIQRQIPTDLPSEFQNKVSADWPVYAARMVTWCAKIESRIGWFWECSGKLV